MSEDNKNVTIENAKIIFRNFSGKEGKFNKEGDRNFAVILDPETAQAMAQDGWNIKETKPREEGDEPVPYLPVRCSYKNRPPRVVMVTAEGRTQLDEDSVEVLDWADIEFVDLIVRPYEWSVNGKSGISAYVKSLFAVIAEDELERKYGINEA